jgi:F-type H+-transporting ATPase subunit a
MNPPAPAAGIEEGLRVAAHGPMDQFAVHPIVPLEIGGYDLSFTNASLWMVIVVASVTLFMMAAASSRSLVPTRTQSLAEIGYNFIGDMIRSTAGTAGLKFFPFIFTLFMFVLFANMLGLLPFQVVSGGAFHQFTVTSHIIVTLALALTVFTMVIVVGLMKHGLRFFSLFVPAVPWYMLPILVPIEIISFLSRPISLSVRLFANMLAGHTMLAVFGSFVAGLLAAGGVVAGLAIAPMLAIIGVTILEFLVAFLQAYVFAILTCIYLNDALHLHDH